MSKKPRNQKDWKRGRDNDSDEIEGHTRPRRTDENIEAPAGTWVDVPKGMIAAPGTYVDDQGFMRSSTDHSYAAWHYQGCDRRGLTPEVIVIDPATNAPWCPDCWQHKVKKEEAQRISKLFQGQQPTGSENAAAN